MSYRRFWRDQKGATAVEYGILASLIGFTVITAVAPLADLNNSTFETLATAMNGGEVPEGAPSSSNNTTSADQQQIGVQRRTEQFGPQPPAGAFGGEPLIQVATRDEAFGPPLAGQADSGSTEIGVVQRNEQFGPMPETEFR